MFTTRIFIPIFILGALSTVVMAETPKEAMDFFIKYTNFANNYDENLLAGCQNNTGSCKTVR